MEVLVDVAHSQPGPQVWKILRLTPIMICQLGFFTKSDKSDKATGNTSLMIICLNKLLSLIVMTIITRSSLTKTLPEAQRTQGIDFITRVNLSARIVQNQF